MKSELSLLATFLSLAWTIGELILFTYLHWAVRYLETGNKRGNWWTIFLCLLLFVVQVWLTFWGGRFIRLNVIPHPGLGWTYPKLLWQFCMTLWVAVEAGCLVYAFWLYRLTRIRFEGRSSRTYFQLLPLREIFICFLFLSVFGIYWFFHQRTFDIVLRGEIKGDGMTNLYHFYTRYCGILFILIEGAIAILAFYCLRLFRKICGATSHG